MSDLMTHLALFFLGFFVGVAFVLVVDARAQRREA